MADESKPGLQLAIDDAIAQGSYSNLQIVGSNETEFVVDFAYVQPQRPVGKINHRIILSPKHAKALLVTLQERVRDHEARHGVIDLPIRFPPGSGLPN